LDVSENGATAAIFDRRTNDGTVIAIQQDSVTVGTISVAGTTVSYNAFTGSHYGWTEGTLERGTLVSMTGENRRHQQQPDSEVVYGISPTAVPNDPRCLDAYLALQEPSQASSDENPHLIMAVGNGEMWVVDRGRGDLRASAHKWDDWAAWAIWRRIVFCRFLQKMQSVRLRHRRM